MIDNEVSQQREEEFQCSWEHTFAMLVLLTFLQAKYIVKANIKLRLLVNIPVEEIRLLDTVCLLLGTPFAAVWSQPGVVCSESDV